MQVYHGTRYIDEVIGLRLEHGRAYVHQDANYNVIGLTDLTGRELERYYYSPYGELEVAFDAHFFDYDDDGDVDTDDLAAATSGGTCWGDYSGDCRRLDADADRDIDAADYTAVNNFLSGLSGDMELQRIPAATHSQVGNPFGRQGLIFDAEIASYQNRARQYALAARRFMQRDPLALKPRAASGYQDGINLYRYLGSNPSVGRDPLGLRWLKGGCVCKWYNDCDADCQSSGDYGKVYCMSWPWGNCTCICDGNISADYPNAADLLTDCVEEHEKVHDARDCEGGECPAFAEGGNCARLKVDDCLTNQCIDDIISFIADGLANCETYCPSGGSTEAGCKYSYCGALEDIVNTGPPDLAQRAGALHAAMCGQ